LAKKLQSLQAQTCKGEFELARYLCLWILKIINPWDCRAKLKGAEQHLHFGEGLIWVGEFVMLVIG
jgi:hypothetical protein